MESHSTERNLMQFFNERGIKIKRKDYKPTYFERVVKKIKYEFTSYIPDLGKLFKLKNKLIGLGYYGETSSIRGRFACNIPENVFLGDRVFINYDCMFLSDDLILIGSNVLIGPRVGIFTSNHELNKDTSFKLEKYPVFIEKNSWIGAYSIILPGVNISEGTQIGAGSVITKSTEPYSWYAGNPARKIKDLENIGSGGMEKKRW